VWNTGSWFADNLSKAGWSWGCVATVDFNGQTIFVADAHRDNGKRFIVTADEKLRAFLELQRVTRESLRFWNTEWFADVVVCLDHVACLIVNANHSVMWAAEKLGVVDCVCDCFWPAIPHRTIGKRITD
jgi:hypothetical protein